MNHKTSRNGALAVGCAVIIWYFNGACYAVGTRSIGPMPFLAITCALGALTGALLHFAATRSLRGLIRRSGWAFILDIFGVTGYCLLYTTAIGLSENKDLGQIILVNYTFPVWIVLLGPVLARTRLSALSIAGALLGLVAVALARGAEGLTRPATSYLPHALMLVGSISWATYCVLVGKLSKGTFENGMPAQFAICGLVAALLALRSGAWHWVSLPPSNAAWIIFCGIGPTGVGYYLWEMGVKNGDPAKAATMAYTIPIGSVLVMGLVFRESLSAVLLPSAALLVVATFLVSRGSSAQDDICSQSASVCTGPTLQECDNEKGRHYAGTGQHRK